MHKSEKLNVTQHIFSMLCLSYCYFKRLISLVMVQKIPRIQNEEEKKRVLMDLQVVMKSHDCPYIVKCFGLLIAEVD